MSWMEVGVYCFSFSVGEGKHLEFRTVLFPSTTSTQPPSPIGCVHPATTQLPNIPFPSTLHFASQITNLSMPQHPSVMNVRIFCNIFVTNMSLSWPSVFALLLTGCRKNKMLLLEQGKRHMMSDLSVVAWMHPQKLARTKTYQWRIQKRQWQTLTLNNRLNVWTQHDFFWRTETRGVRDHCLRRRFTDT